MKGSISFLAVQNFQTKAAFVQILITMAKLLEGMDGKDGKWKPPGIHSFFKMAG